ncbi:hypothetical protein ScPMuIL_017880 [Solemya velum]
MAGLITLLVYLALTITVVWTFGYTPNQCERSYKECLSWKYERFKCHFARLHCLYKYCNYQMNRTDAKRKKKTQAAALAGCLGRYYIPSPMWIDQSGHKIRKWLQEDGK